MYDCSSSDAVEFEQEAKDAAKYAYGARHSGEEMGRDIHSTPGQVLSMSTFIQSALTGSTASAGGGQRSERGALSPRNSSTCHVKRGKGTMRRRGGRDKKMKIGEVYYMEVS